MAELDLSLSDALTDGVPQASPESRVERDFVAQLESEPFDDEVGETVGKTDYIPLLDNDDNRAAAGSALENGEKEVQGVQKPGLKLAASHSEPQGEVRLPSLDQAFNIDLLADFSQPADVSAAPLSGEKPPSVAEAQLSTPQSASDVPKDHSPMLPEPQPPRSPMDLPPGAIGDSWPNKGSCLASDLPFTPSVSTVISRHAGHLGANPEDQPDGWPGRESGAYAGGDERETEGLDRKQKKKKKRRQKDEGAFEHAESRGPAEAQVQGESTPGDDFYNRIGPRRDRGEAGWEEQLGKGRGKKSKSRKKIPEEWSVMAEPFVPSSAATPQIVPDVMMDLGSSGAVDSPFSDQHNWRPEPPAEEDLIPTPLSQDVFAPTINPISPLVLNSELKATAAPFTMPGSFPAADQPDDSFDLLMDLENGNQTFPNPYSAEVLAADMVDSGIFDKTTPLQDSQVIPDGDTSAFSSASQASPPAKDDVEASAPPLSPSDASWFLNESQVSSSNDIFEFTDNSGHQLPLGLSFDTPSPAPLRSPKTTAQESQPKDTKKSRKSRQSSSSKSPTSPDVIPFPTEDSQAISPSSPPAPGSALNPSAKPFFPSFADPVVDPAEVSPVSPTVEVKAEKEEKKDEIKKDEKTEEKLEDILKMPEAPSPIEKAEQKGVTVEFTSNEPPAKMEAELPKAEPFETKKEEAKEVEQVKVEETPKVEPMQVEEKPEKMVKVVEPSENKADQEEFEHSPIKMEEKVEKMDFNEKPQEPIEEKIQNKTPEKLAQPEMKEELKTPEPQVMSVKEPSVEPAEKKIEPEPIEEKVEPKPIEKKQELEPTETKVEQKEFEKKVEPEPIEKEAEPKPTEKKAEPEPTETKVEQKTVEKVEPEPVEKKEEPETKVEQAKTEEVKKVEKEPEKEPEKVQEDTQNKAAPEKKTVDKKDDKKAKADAGDKAKKAKPVTNGSSAVPSKEKAKPASAAPAKPGITTKTRPTSATAPPTGTAATKKPTPSSTTDKKTLTARAPTAAKTTATTARPTATTAKVPSTTRPLSTTTAGPKRPPSTSSSRPTSTTTAARDVKPKTVPEKRAPVPKASSDSASAAKNGAAPAPRSTTTTRTTTTARPAASTAARKPLASKTESKPGEEKKAGTLRTSTDAAKPKPTTTRTIPTSSAPTARPRPTAAKPSTPSSSVGEKKPATPRTPRPTSTSSSTTATTATATTRSTTTRTSTTRTTATRTTTAPDVRSVRSKIGSTDNMKHQPGGGKVPSASQSRGVASKEPSQAKVQITNKKVDLSKVTSKCGSKDNIKHKPGGGDVKIESHKVNYKDKVQSKVGSLDNVGHSPGGGNVKAEGDQEPEGQETGLPTDAPAPPSPSAEGGAAHHNGLCEGEGAQALDALIPETSL
ncbi:microtubule-associated protein 4 isoform X3 [Boleophthalmus pectinirostris]|uniref:microtubule-associated protein 4 isoform X3 n=1 Tax=Boleophthalmus pectinirostris TaxID=150288 RepID=UPI00242F432D|nr:microtubule-associated protein 4 isoform X3 [Boleophthalmus pectinirostris]